MQKNLYKEVSPAANIFIWHLFHHGLNCLTLGHMQPLIGLPRSRFCAETADGIVKTVLTPTIAIDSLK
ncbi:hypothetical protein [Scytonema sp. NUACC26]|uniref:hypothetical protein n=1 Tax=Scytonema sp. NUACC26 TaxID=3140176 RepID=UPI0038B239BD